MNGVIFIEKLIADGAWPRNGEQVQREDDVDLEQTMPDEQESHMLIDKLSRRLRLLLSGHTVPTGP